MFAWDSANLSHIARHRVSSIEAEEVIANDPLDLERQLRNGEPRILLLGETTSGRVLFVVVTVRRELIRVVTAYPADRQSRKYYSIQRDASNVKDFRDP